MKDDQIRSRDQQMEDAMEAAGMAWWSLEFPSGALDFSENKTKMLGYDKADFYHYTKFTDLLHPEDYEPTMQAMRDLMSGQRDIYECKYRIKASDGSYKTFYDRGRVVERLKDSYTVAGMVFDVSSLELLTSREVAEQSD